METVETVDPTRHAEIREVRRCFLAGHLDGQPYPVSKHD